MFLDLETSHTKFLCIFVLLPFSEEGRKISDVILSTDTVSNDEEQALTASKYNVAVSESLIAKLLIH